MPLINNKVKLKENNSNNNKVKRIITLSCLYLLAFYYFNIPKIP